MSTSPDHRFAAAATAIRAGDTIRVTIPKGRTIDCGTFTGTVYEHAEVPGLLCISIARGVIVVQRPNGDQPYPVARAAAVAR